MTRLRYLTAGESHGQALIGIIEGVPSGLKLNAERIHSELRRRKLGYGRGTRQKIESDELRILSGVRHGMTLGSPIALMIENRDWSNWAAIMQAESPDTPDASRRKVEIPRPGHADYVGGLKYGHEDMRNVLERASARETAIRVALASIARVLLDELGMKIASHVLSIGSAAVEKKDIPSDVSKMSLIADASPVRTLSPEGEARMIAEIEAAKKKGDTLGGVFEVICTGTPVGLGSYAHWDRRIEGEIARQLMSLNAIKGVEVGLGFEAASLPGSLVHDELFPAKPGLARHGTNRSGGIDGGMTNGEPIVVRAAMKPIATLMKPLRSVRLRDGVAESAHVERSDVCAVPAAAVIGEALLALVLAEAVLDKFGADSMDELSERVRKWNEKTVP